ncbi:translation initiation factor IF-5A [Nanoarchaeota archaeon]
MPLKIISASEIRAGTNVLIDNNACSVKSVDISKTGKHGHAKVRMECIGLIDGKKRIVLKPGHDKFDVPLVEKKRGQVLSTTESNASIMDVESFETLNVDVISELKGTISEGDQVEYWDIEGTKIIKRKI